MRVLGARGNRAPLAIACALAAVATLTLSAPRASALNTVSEDQLVTGNMYGNSSLCVGLDCVVPESFGFDTLRLKENNMQIAFDDTSVGAFPANDWAIVANSTVSGGPNYLAFRDVTGSSLPFLVEAGAPSDSLRVAPGGNVGIGTASPTSKLP